MTTFVCCHGAWGGGWGWKRVATILRDNGHEVFTPTYTGQGERSHLLNRDIDLETHIADIRNVIKYERLDGFVLVVTAMAAWWSPASPTRTGRKSIS